MKESGGREDAGVMMTSPTRGCRPQAGALGRIRATDRGHALDRDVGRRP